MSQPMNRRSLTLSSFVLGSYLPIGSPRQTSLLMRCSECSIHSFKYRFPAQFQLCNERSMSPCKKSGYISMAFQYAAVIATYFVCNCDHISLLERDIILLEREPDHGIRFSLEPEPTLLANAIQVFSVSKNTEVLLFTIFKASRLSFEKVATTY